MSQVISARLSDPSAKRLRKKARQAGRKPSELAARYLQESLIADDYPGIVFVEGPAGRRAHLAGTGLDAWEVMLLIEDGLTQAQIQKEFGISAGLINSAVRYAADYSDDIAAFMPPDEHSSS